MNCPDAESIELYACKKLDEAQAAELEAHLKICPECNDKAIKAAENETLASELRALTDNSSLKTQGRATEADDVSTPDRAQQLLGDRYKVIRTVGEGAAGVVFQAFDSILNRHVAIKFLRRRKSEQGFGRWDEARMMGQLNHANIAQVYEIGEIDSQRFLVMEWVDGLPLTEVWADMPTPQRLRIFVEVVNAIAEAHRRGIVHRDIKPSNILVTAASRPKVLDFGIALECRSLNQIDRGLYRGTPAYSAPEQIIAPEKIGPATDVFALGVLLYQLLTGSLPFPQTDPKELFRAIRNDHPELPRAIEEKVPIPLQNICLKALEKSPDNRYSNAQSLSDDIHRYLRGEIVWTRPSFLTDKIQQEVFYHRQRLKVWHQNDLVTQREFDQLENIYERMVSPPDPSIIEARRLSLSQVCLYLGGWVVVLGSFVLFYEAWDQIPKYWRPTPALIACALMIISGLVLWGKGESRLGVGFLAMGNILLPLAVLLALGHWHMFSPESFLWGEEIVVAELSDAHAHLVVGNRQLYVTASCWLLSSLLFLRSTRSSAFVLYACIAFLVLLSVCYVIAGMLGPHRPWEPDIIAGRYLYPAAGLFAIGVVLDRKGHTHFAWPLCLIGLVLVVICLSVIAISDATLFGWIGFERLADHEKSICLSFACNGLAYLGLAGVCRQSGTRLQRRLALVLNWLGPAHILAPLRILDGLVGGSLNIYRLLLPVAAILFVLGSVPRQMKSFFFSGLAGVAVAIHTFTTRCPFLDDRFSWPISLILTGLLWMFLSWLVPRWQARRALRGS
jgi:serine/threonine-protein kinase